MYITEIFEAQEPSSILVIYPGRFQPWHKGHKMVYDYLTKIYGRDHVFVATSNKVDPPRSPFTFSEKQQFMHLTGISADRIVETRDPYRALEIVQKYNPATTRLVLAVSEKDMAEDPRFKFGYKKDGSPTYLQQMPERVNDMQPFETHGYIMTVPTFKFTVLGEPMRSATEVRAQFAQADESTQQSIIKDLFGTYDRHVHDIMKQKLLPVVTESVTVGTKLNLTKNYGNFETLTGVVKDITPSGKLKIQITQAQLVPGKKGAVRVGDVVTMASNYIKNTIAENFADGKNPQDKGDAKRHGINTKASVSSLRKTAKSGGRKGQLAHWLANMKSGRARAKNESVAEGSGQEHVDQQNKKFILYLNNRAIAKFDTEDEAKQQAQMVVARVPGTQIEIKQEICTLSSVELKENLKKCVQEAWSQKYKNSINCSNPKGFSQKAHCAGKNEDIEEARKKKAQKKNTFKGYYFPGYVYYGMTGDGQVGSDSGGMAEGEVVPFARKPQPKLTWQQVPKDVLLLANEWYWADWETGSLDAVLDPNGYGNGVDNEVQYIAAKLQQKGWTIDHNDDNDPRMGPFNLVLTSKLGQSVLLPNNDADNFTGWAAGTRPSMQEGNENPYRRPTASEANRTAQQTQAKLNPTASKFVWKKPNQIGGSYSEQDLMAKGFKKSQYNSWGGTQAMWDRLTRVSEQLNQPTPTAQQILDKHNLTVEEFITQLRLGVKVEFEHTKDAKTAYEIALDHLNERPDYYTVLAKTGLEEDSANPRIDLTPNYPNYSKLIGEFMGVNRNQKAVFKILAAELKPGQGSTDKIVRSVSTGKLIAIDISRVKNRLTVAEAASGYIPTKAEKDDPRFKTALTVDVRPGTDKKNMRALRLIK